MSASIREQILARLAAVLTGTTPAGANVFRSREVALDRQLTPSIVIRPQNEEDEPFGTRADKHELTVDVIVFVRGDPFDSLADPVATAAHALICQDAQLATLIRVVRKHTSTWEAEEADRTFGSLAMQYRFTYLTDARDISLALT